MLYDSYQLVTDGLDQLRAASTATAKMMEAWRGFLPPVAGAWSLAGLEAFGQFGFTHTRPDFGVHEAEHKGERFPVTHSLVLSTPFCHLQHFVREGGENDPKVLLVAPMSGHFATLLRGTLKTMLRDHQVYLTDWLNPRETPLDAGVFGLEAYTRHLMDFIRFIGPDCHVVAVCQPTVSALCATALLADEGPASLTLMAGPIDVRIAPNGVNKLANDKPLSWFRDNMISTVPRKFAGAGRRVYPGFLQLSAFMSMNSSRHQGAYMDFMRYRAEGEDSKAEAIQARTCPNSCDGGDSIEAELSMTMWMSM